MIRKTNRTWLNDRIKEIGIENKNRNSKLIYKKIGEQNKVYKEMINWIKSKEGKIIIENLEGPLQVSINSQDSEEIEDEHHDLFADATKEKIEDYSIKY